MRRGRLILSAILTLAVLVLLTGTVAGWGVYREHFDTARGVVEEYAAFAGNLSLLGLLAGLEGPSGLPHPVARVLYFGLGAAIVGGVVRVLRRHPGPADGEPARLDLEYALFTFLMVMLSPVAWDHYLVVLILPERPVHERLRRIAVHAEHHRCHVRGDPGLLHQRREQLAARDDGLG